MVKSLAAFCVGLLAFGFASCDDELDVMQAYPFTVETMPVPKELKQGETAEIRCELVREGEFNGAVYTIRYFQYDGEGTLKLDNGLIFQPNDRYLLENEKFRLYYTSECDESQSLTINGCLQRRCWRSLSPPACPHKVRMKRPHRSMMSRKRN